MNNNETFFQLSKLQKMNSAEKKDVFACFLVILRTDSNRIISMRLPKMPDGVIHFPNAEKETVPVRFEAINGVWNAVCISPYGIIDASGTEYNQIELRDGMLIPISHMQHRYFLSIEAKNTNHLTFINYSLMGLSEITIGRSNENDIVCDNHLVSGLHAKLIHSNSNWKIVDCGSSNGVFVNGIKVPSAALSLGDNIYINGIQIIMGVGFISICNSRFVHVKENRLPRFMQADTLSVPLPPQKKQGESDLFNRLPRRRAAFNPPKIVIEPPPMSLKNSQIPMLLRLGSSMVMGGTSALAGNYTMLLSSVAFPFITQKYTDKQRKEYEAKREETYGNYLNNLRSTLKKEKLYEETVLNQNYPEIDELLSYPFNKQKLWERRKTDDDFLLLRIGHGNLPLFAEIEYPKRRFAIEEDNLETEMYQIAESKVKIENVPVLTSIIDNHICGIAGDREFLFSYIERVIFQIAILHSYDEVKLFFLIDSNDLKRISYVKYLPHTWDDNKTTRFIATNTSEAFQIGEYLRQYIEPDFKESGNRDLKYYLQSRPYFVVFAFDKHMLDSMEFIKELMQKEKNYGVSVLTAFDDMPKECTHVFNINGIKNNNLVFLKEIDRDHDRFTLDHVNFDYAYKSMRAVSNTNLKGTANAYSLPKSVSFLEMFHVGKAEQLNPWQRWHENNPIQSLSTPIGVGTDGGLFYLDLHQKFQGPHGLVAGMTGSGKSEFLITYILSMAVNYHPDEVAFVLIDYKGGGLAGAFDNPTFGIHLPHLIGTITNLDGATIQRSIISIQSELLRRQKAFNEVKDINNEGTMDIYTYQRMYRNGKVKNPMPHLFIISDEFAELKQQQPEFMDDLISIARIGRSLGVHLILATQKPSGVVNDQIRSNTKFRICLKVQDRNDSTDMLQRPEAAEIKETGRFYLQVGFNEYFAMGQSAWCGAEYIPSDEVVIKKDDSVQFIDAIGSDIMVIKPPGNATTATGSQLTAIVKLLSDIADSQHVRPKQLWEHELPDVIDAKDLSHRHSPEALDLALGKIDDPQNLRQFPLIYDMTHCKNLLIVGSQGSGKSCLLQYILLTFIKSYPLDMFHFYVLDFSSRIFKIFNSLPNCGGVLYDEDSDSLDKFFEIINQIIKQRKQLFSQLEVESFDAANAIQPLPVILVIIDNLAELSNTKIGERHFYQLGNYLRECASYGVKYIITCGQLNDLTSRMRYSIEDCIALCLKDKYAYGDAINCRVEYTPPKKPGRGLFKLGERPLELQLCIHYPALSDKDRIAAIKQLIGEINVTSHSGTYAEKMPVISDTATYEQFYSQFKRGRIPLGYSKKDAKPVAIPFKQLSALSVYIGNPDGKIPILENFLYAAKQEQTQTIIIKSSKDSYFDTENNIESVPNARLINPDEKVLDLFWKELAGIIQERKQLVDSYCLDHGLDNINKDVYNEYYSALFNKSTPVLILVENYDDFCNHVSTVGSLVFDKLFSVAQKFNVYVIGFFHPLENKEALKNPLLSAGFNPDNNTILLGGHFDKQRICQSDALSQANLSAQLPYNLGVMQYKGGFYPLLVPCGEVETRTIDEDDQDIF